MVRVLIVDDDSLIHFTLRSMIDWEKYGYSVVYDCNNGNHALHYLKNNDVDLLITDMKMPSLNGLDLMRRLRQEGRLPVTLVLSGYDEFELVREAFRLGAYDYLLKSDINSFALERMLKNLKQNVFLDENSRYFAEKDRNRVEGLDGEYIVALFNIEDAAKIVLRFGDNLKERLEKPMVELVNQIHRLRGRMVFRARNPMCYEMYYEVRDKGHAKESVCSAVRQIRNIWRDYMNIEVQVGISDVTASEDIEQTLLRCETLCKISALEGLNGVCLQWEWDKFAQLYEKDVDNFDVLATALCLGDARMVRSEEERLLGKGKLLEVGCDDVLVLIVRLLDVLKEKGKNWNNIFPEGTQLQQIMQQMKDPLKIEFFLHSFFRRVLAICGEKDDVSNVNSIERAKKFVQENFQNPELSLKMVAEYVGLNEKYFSSRFAKECGCTFVVYLNDVRISRAQELLSRTEMRMYEISEAVGYGSVEHFNHIFKKKLCISPSEFRKNRK